MGKQADISNRLRQEIEAGVYQAGGRFPAEGELAERFGSNKITVNKAVAELVKEGYLKRSASSRAGTVVLSNTVFPRGLIGFLADFTISFYIAMMNGAVDAATARGYAVVSMPVGPQNLEKRLCEMESGKSFTGLLSSYYTVLNTRLPVVYLDKDDMNHHDNLYHVRCNSREGGVLLANHLLAEGRRDVAYSYRIEEESSLLPRRRGFVETMRKAGVRDIDKRIFRTRFHMHGMKQSLGEIVRLYPDLTALVCENDLIAFFMLHAGQSIGIDIGGKIKLTGFGNVPEVQLVRPFTTIDQHPYETGFRGCHRLIDLAEHPETPQPLIEEHDVELVVH